MREIAEKNLLAWKQSGVVKTREFYSADDGDGCGVCQQHHEKVVALVGEVVGLKLPPLDVCTNARCRCDFRPRGCDVAMKRLARGVRDQSRRSGVAHQD